MKLVRHGQPGAERAGLIDAQGVLRDLSMLLPDIGPTQLAPRTLAALAAIDAARLPAVEPGTRLGCPVGGVGKIVCVGLNYADHAAEADALAHVAGYVLANDVSERSYQMERGGQWDKGKGCDTFAPVGPWLVTTDEIPDPHAIGLWLEVNGQRMQDGHTRNFIFGVPRVLAYISQFMTLEPGDLVLTGTPAGVGLGQKPTPRFLRAGDVMRLGATGLGEQRLVCTGG